MSDGLLSTLGTYITASNYNAASELTSLTFGNSDVSTYTYDSQNLRLTQLVTNHNSTPLQNLSYTYDNVGNVQTITDSVRSETSNYQYDDLNRLLSASVSNGPNPYSQSFTYNPIGNITQRTDNGTPTTYTYLYNPNDPHQKPHAVTQMGTQYYCYDANGNMTKHNASSSACTNGDAFTYDVENRLTQVVTSGGVTTTYVYDGDGNRIVWPTTN